MCPSQPRLQPQPPSSPTHNESRRSSAKAARVVKYSLKGKTASTNSVCKTEVGSDTPTKTAMVQKGEPKPQEPGAACTVVQPRKHRRTVKAAEAHSDGKGDHPHPPSGSGPEEQPKHEEVAPGRFQEQLPGVPCDAASHTPEAEVSRAFPLHTATAAQRSGWDAGCWEAFVWETV